MVLVSIIYYLNCKNKINKKQKLNKVCIHFIDSERDSNCFGIVLEQL